MHLYAFINSGNIFNLITLSLILRVQASQFVVPQIFTHDTLVNVVTSYKPQNLETIHFHAKLNTMRQRKILNTYTSWTTTGLKLQIPEHSLKGNLTIKMYYFRLQHKLGSEKILFYLLTEGNFLETARAIDNSGFGTSSTVPFFILVNSPFDKILFKFTQSLENQLYFEFIRPFLANIIFFGLEWTIQVGFCYHCPEQKLFAVSSFSVDIALQAVQVLNSNGYANQVSVSSRLYMVFVAEVSNLKSCWDDYPGHKAGRDKLLYVVKNCVIFDEMFISPLQNLLNVTFVTSLVSNVLSQLSLINVPTESWFLDINTGEAILMAIPNRFAITRGVIYPAVQYDNLFDKLAFCNSFFDPDSVDLNLSFISVVDSWVWGLFVVVILCYLLIWKRWKYVSLFLVIMGRSISIPKVFRKHIIIYLSCATYFCWIYNSYVSSETLRLQDINDPVWYAKKGYKVYASSSSRAAIASLYVPFKEMFAWKNAVKKVEKMYEFIPNGSVENVIDTKPFLHLDFLRIVEHMSKNKVSLLQANSKSFGLVRFFKKKGRILIENKYSCQLADVSKFISLPIRLSYRVRGYLSSRFEKIYNTWMEIGWMQKVAQLMDNANSLKLGMHNVDIVVLDRFPPSHPLKLWSIIGLAVAAHVLLVIGLLILKLATEISSIFKIGLSGMLEFFKRHRKLSKIILL